MPRPGSSFMGGCVHRIFEPVERGEVRSKCRELGQLSRPGDGFGRGPEVLLITLPHSGDAVVMMVATLVLLASLHAAPADVSKTFDPSTDSRSDRKGRERGILAPTEV